MKRASAGLIFFVLNCTATTSRAAQPAAAPFPGHQFDHVVIVVLENEDNTTVRLEAERKAGAQITHVTISSPLPAPSPAAAQEVIN